MYQQISRLQFVYLIYSQVIGLNLLIIPFMISKSVVRDSWMVGPVFILVSSMLSFVIVWFIRTFPGQTLVEGINSALGHWLGPVFTIWILIWLFVVTSNDIFETTLFVSTTLFPNTPSYIISFLLIVPVAYAVYMGLEVVGRLSEIILPVMVFITFVLLLLAYQYADISHLKPVLADGFSPILRAAMSPSTFAMKFLITLFMVQSLQKDAPIGRDLLITSLFIGLTGLFAELTSTLVLGQIRVYSTYTVSEIVRSVSIGEFIQRLDTFYVIIIITTTFLNLAALLYSISVGIQQLFKIDSYRPFVWGSGMVVWAGSVFLFRDSQTQKYFLMHTAPGYYYFTAIVIPVLAILVHLVRKRTKYRSHR